MNPTALKYCCLISFSLLSIITLAQPNNQAVLTIIGDPVGNNDNVGNFNPYQQQAQAAPPQQQAFQETNVLIEPSLENGFHMRFEVGMNQPDNSFNSKPSLSSSGGGGVAVKVKKRQPSMTERTFNMKKKLKSWLPKRKKRYRPNLCGRF